MHRIPSFVKLAAALAAVLIGPGSAVAVQAAETTPVYADGQTYTMVAAKAMPASNSGLAKAPPLWVMVFVPSAVPPGYTPQCDPCDHPNNPNLPGGGDFHDHLLPSVPGLGNNGTAGEYTGPWMITIVVFNPAFTHGNTSFEPIKSDWQLAAVEAASAAALSSNGVPELLPINPNGANRFERATDTVLICPIIQKG
jgi:hypothetical protein